MVLRVNKRIIHFLLVVGSLFLLGGCEWTLTHSNSDPQIKEVYDLLDKHYYENLPLNLSKIKSVEELLSYTDPYTQIYATTRSIDMGSSYVGLGITIQNHEKGLLISDISKDTDRDQYLYVGDIITHIDSAALEDIEFEDKTALLKGELGDIKKLTILRLTYSVIVSIPLIEVPYQSIVYEKIGTIGYIKIERFASEIYGYDNEGKRVKLFNSTGEDFVLAIEDLERQNIESLLIDVRNNGGGYLSSALEILREFIVDTEPFLYLLDVKQNTYYTYKSDLKEKKTYPVSVLMNKNSASASEVLAGTLQKYGYPLIGEQSYGKDVYQISLELKSFPQGTFLSLTEGYWLLHDKTRVLGGLSPEYTHMQTGVLSVSYPYLYQEFEKGDSHALISTFQYLLSRETASFYEPGFFDDNLENMILQYQTTHNLEPTGILDVQTQLKLIDMYRGLIKDKTNDNQLKYALSIQGTLK